VQISLVICTAGHRPDKLGGYTKEVAIKLMATARHAIKTLRPKQVISGMALGWDQALAIAANEAGIPFIAAVPLRSFSSKWNPESQKRYESLLGKAVKVVYVDELTDGKYQEANNFLPLVDTIQ